MRESTLTELAWALPRDDLRFLNKHQVTIGTFHRDASFHGQLSLLIQDLEKI